MYVRRLHVVYILAMIVRYQKIKFRSCYLCEAYYKADIPYIAVYLYPISGNLVVKADQLWPPSSRATRKANMYELPGHVWTSLNGVANLLLQYSETWRANSLVNTIISVKRR